MKVEIICENQKQLQICIDHFDHFKRRNTGVQLPPGSFTKVQDTADFVNIICLAENKYLIAYKDNK